MKIKIISYESHGCCSGDCYDEHWVVGGVTDWDDVSEPQYQLLREWTREQNRNHPTGTQYVIYRQEAANAPQRIQEYLDLIEERKKLERQRRDTAKARKRQRELAKKQEREQLELAQLAELKAKYEGRDSGPG